MGRLRESSASGLPWSQATGHFVRREALEKGKGFVSALSSAGVQAGAGAELPCDANSEWCHLAPSLMKLKPEVKDRGGMLIQKKVITLNSQEGPGSELLKHLFA